MIEQGLGRVNEKNSFAVGGVDLRKTSKIIDVLAVCDDEAIEVSIK